MLASILGGNASRFEPKALPTTLVTWIIAFPKYGPAWKIYVDMRWNYIAKNHSGLHPALSIPLYSTLSAFCPIFFQVWRRRKKRRCVASQPVFRRHGGAQGLWVNSKNRPKIMTVSPGASDAATRTGGLCACEILWPRFVWNAPDKEILRGELYSIDESQRI